MLSSAVKKQGNMMTWDNDCVKMLKEKKHESTLYTQHSHTMLKGNNRLGGNVWKMLTVVIFRWWDVFLDFTDLLISLKTLTILGVGKEDVIWGGGRPGVEPRAGLEQQDEKGREGIDFTSYASDINWRDRNTNTFLKMLSFITEIQIKSELYFFNEFCYQFGKDLKGDKADENVGKSAISDIG